MTHLLSALAFLLFQDDATQAAPPTLNHGNAVMDMLRNSGPVAMTVLAVLLFGSLFSWAIIFGKWGSVPAGAGAEQAVPAGVSQSDAAAGNCHGERAV